MKIFSDSIFLSYLQKKKEKKKLKIWYSLKWSKKSNSIMVRTYLHDMTQIFVPKYLHIPQISCIKCHLKNKI